MVNAGQASLASSTITPLNVRAVVGRQILTATGAREEVPVAQPATPAAVAQVRPALLYNSFEFAYKQIIGKIVLDYRQPETGEVIQQIPSEKHLRQYAEAQKAVRTGAQSSGPRETKAALEEAVTQQATPAREAPAREVPAVPVLAPAPVQASAPKLDIKV